MLNAPILRRTVVGLALFCGLLTTPVSAQTLPQILLDMGAASEAAVRAEATSQAASEPRYRSRMAGDLRLFTGPFVPDSANTKLAIFSDDGCTVRIDGNAVHSRSGQGQHLPDLNQSFHVLDFTFVAGQSYDLVVEYTNTIYPGDWDVDGCTLFAFGGGGGTISVDVTVANGRFVGCGRDTTRAQLQAAVTPTTPTPTYAWSTSNSVPGDAGSGHFTTPTTATTGFAGDSFGAVTAKVTVSSPSGTAEKSVDLVVIEIGDLSEPVPPDPYYEQINLDGDGELSWNVPYQDGAGKLRAVRIVPPASPDPFIAGSDFDHTLDSNTGEVNLKFQRDGAYVVKVIRIDQYDNIQSKIVSVRKNTKNAVIGLCDDGKTEERPRPTADLVLIDASLTDAQGLPDDALANMRRSFSPNYKPISSVQSAISRIIEYRNNHPGQNFSVLVLGHGNMGFQCFGGSTRNAEGQYLSPAAACNNDRNDFTTACRQCGVTTIIFGGCCVGKGQTGLNFLKQIANASRATVEATNSYTYWSGNGKFALREGAYWAIASPDP